MDAANERSYLMGLHLTGISGLLSIPGFIGPLVMWLIKKGESPDVDAHGKEALNFHLTMLIGYVIGLVLMLVLIGFLVVFVVVILEIVFSIIAAVQANKGGFYRYPLTIRFIK